MQYLMLNDSEQRQLLEQLSVMSSYLRSCFAGLTAEQALIRGPDDTFSPVEQVWHLADLERDGFALRIRRLLTETDPQLEDFDGACAARERDYRSRSLADGIKEFDAARRRNIDALAGVRREDWKRHGVQAGVGTVSMCDIPSMMAQHDAAHRQEIEAWQRLRTSPPTA